MPTAHEFDVAANGLESAAATVDQMLSRSHSFFGPETMRDGRLPLLVDLTLDTQLASARAASDLLLDLAELCRLRASACRQYAGTLALHRAELSRWRELQDDPDNHDIPRPRPPQPPGRWAEA